MKIKRAQMLGVSAFVAGGTILLGTWGCGSEPKPTSEASKQAQATEAPAPQPASATEDAQMHALIDKSAPEAAPAVQPKETVKAEAAPPVSTHPATTVHVVKRGETLSSISQQYYGTKANWKLILDANSTVVKNANDLRPNMKLVIPAAKTTTAKVAATHPAKTGTMLSATTLAPSDAAPAGASAASASAKPSL